MTDYEYFDNSKSKTPAALAKQKKAILFSYEREFAFFSVNFGMARADFESLTEVEKLFFYKEYETKQVTFFTYARNSVLNGVINAMKKKTAKFVELFKKKQAKVDKGFNQKAVEVVNEIEKRDGKSWVQKIFKENAGFISGFLKKKSKAPEKQGGENNNG